jgi:hypothetical protein
MQDRFEVSVLGLWLQDPEALRSPTSVNADAALAHASPDPRAGR